MGKSLKLANQALIDFIYDKYYVRQEDSGADFISSYWDFYSKKFDVRLDEKGNILSLYGMAFGEMMVKNPLYKLLSYICHLSYFVKLPYKVNILKIIPSSLKVCSKMRAFFSFDCFKQVCSLELIMRHMTNGMKRKHLNFLIIGDGYGFLSSLIKLIIPDSTIVLVDIGKTLLFQSIFCQKVHPAAGHYGINEEYGVQRVDFLYCPTEYLEKLNFTFDIAINIASMQEMNSSTIERYFLFLRQNCNQENLFYCCNRELKILPGGEVLEFKKYPWYSKDKHLIDEYCPWYKYFLSYKWARFGPKLFGMRIPLINYFDGAIMHRLTVMFTEKRK